MKSKQKNRIIIIASSTILFAILILYVLYYLSIEYSNRYSVKEKECNKYTEDEFLENHTSTLNEKNLCYENFFYPKNCNWIELSEHINSQVDIGLRSKINLQQLRNVAKELEKKGLKICEEPWVTTLYGIPQKYLFSKWKNSPLVNNIYIQYELTSATDEHLDDQYPMEVFLEPRLDIIPDGIYTGFGKELIRANKEGEKVVSYELKQDKQILTLVQITHTKPRIIDTYNISAQKDLTGPYYITLSPLKWAIFKTDFSMCDIVQVVKKEQAAELVHTKCAFNSDGTIKL